VPSDDRRVCDVAAHALASLWPQRYRFKSGGSLFERDEQRIRLYNIWLHTRGKPAIPLPVRPKIVPASSSEMTLALQRVTAARSGSQRDQALAGIERIGQPALPAVLRALREKNYEPPVKSSLESLAARLACIVRHVEAGPGLRELDPKLSRELSEIRGKPLTAGYLGDLLTRVTDRLRDGLTGVRLWAYRDNDGAGFLLTLDVLPGRLGKSMSMTSRGYSEHVTAGTETVCSEEGGGSWVKKAYPHVDFAEFTKGVRKALVSPPLETVLIFAKLTRTE